MAATQSKRALPAKVAAMKARKRQKLDKPEAAKKETKSTPPRAEKVRLDELAWKEVEMPDRLDDFEGFFGLEEIDDVDVVKEDNGIISYKAAEKSKKRAASEEPEDEDEFTGFDDEESGPAEQKPHEENTSGEAPQRVEAKKQKEKKEKKEKPAKGEKKDKSDIIGSKGAMRA